MERFFFWDYSVKLHSPKEFIQFVNFMFRSFVAQFIDGKLDFIADRRKPLDTKIHITLNKLSKIYHAD